MRDADPLDRIEQWARDTLSVATVRHARDVLALVRVARAARDYVGDPSAHANCPPRDPDDEFDLGCELQPLAAALEELEADK